MESKPPFQSAERFLDTFHDAQPLPFTFEENGVLWRQVERATDGTYVYSARTTEGAALHFLLWPPTKPFGEGARHIIPNGKERIPRRWLFASKRALRAFRAADGCGNADALAALRDWAARAAKETSALAEA